jgi:hypothetical protein
MDGRDLDRLAGQPDRAACFSSQIRSVEADVEHSHVREVVARLAWMPGETGHGQPEIAGALGCAPRTKWEGS